MRRKDGQPKRQALRTKPRFEHSFRSHPDTQRDLHPCWSGSRTSSHASAVSLFAGCGGLDLAFTGGFSVFGKQYRQLKFHIVGAYDNAPDAVEAYRLNLGSEIEECDLRTVQVENLPNAQVLLGGFPCQDFSSSGPKQGLHGPRGRLYEVMVDYMREHKPEVVIGENVPHLARLRGGSFISTILCDLESVGYRFDVWDLSAPDYGIPQSRRRLFLVGVRDGLPGFPLKPRKVSIKDRLTIDSALADLENVTDESVTNQSQYFVATKATSGGGQGDHTNKRGEVAYCIRANARGRIQFHYSLNRRLTVRECARLQSFPDEFVFPFSTQRNLMLIGNAVPPVLGHHVARSVEAYLALLAGGSAGLQQARNGGRAARVSQLELFGSDAKSGNA